MKMEFSGNLQRFLKEFNLDINQAAELFKTDPQNIEAWLRNEVPLAYVGLAELALEYLQNLFALKPDENASPEGKRNSSLKPVSFESKSQLSNKNFLPDEMSRLRRQDKTYCPRCAAPIYKHTKFCGRCGKLWET